MASKGTTEQMTDAMVDNKIADENLNMNQFQSAKPAANRVRLVLKSALKKKYLFPQISGTPKRLPVTTLPVTGTTGQIKASRSIVKCFIKFPIKIDQQLVCS